MSNENHNQVVGDLSLMAYLRCDLLQRRPNLASAASVRCPRCKHELWRRREDSLNRTTALATAAAVLYLVANTVPMLGLTVVGREASTTIIGGAEHLWQDGQMTVAVLVLFTAVLAPAMQIIVMLAILLGTRRQPVPSWVDTLLHHHGATQTWSMVEVMLLGVLVALVKIADYATVIPGTALFVLGALIVVLAAMQASFDPREVWERIQWLQAEDRPGTGDEATAGVGLRTRVALTAMQHGLQSCETCGLLSRPRSTEEQGKCPRCGHTLEFRKPASIQRAWALLIAAAICYIPANVLPVLTTTTAAGAESDTILQGVVLFWSPTGWPLSLIVLVASIMIPSARFWSSVTCWSLYSANRQRIMSRVFAFTVLWSSSGGGRCVC